MHFGDGHGVFGWLDRRRVDIDASARVRRGVVDARVVESVVGLGSQFIADDR
jgi:hypothetical protein